MLNPNGSTKTRIDHFLCDTGHASNITDIKSSSTNMFHLNNDTIKHFYENLVTTKIN